MKMLEDLEKAANLARFGDKSHAYRDGLFTGFFIMHHATIRDMAKRLEECEQECLEQARLLGMGSELEAALMARLEAAEKVIARIKEMRDEWDCDAREYLITYGQHLPASVECMVEKIDTAMREGGGE